MTWWAIEVGPGGTRPDVVAERLASLTGQAVEERSAELVVGFAADAASAAGIAAELRTTFGRQLWVRVGAIEPVDWSSRWREGMRVHRVGRLALGPSWLLEPGPGRVVIDPAMAFGTAEHGSTRGAIALLDRHLPTGATVLDVGSGSGILSIAAIQLGAARAVAVEIDAEAEPFALENAVRNGVADRVDFLTGDARLLIPLLGRRDLVVANILRDANVELLPAIAGALGPDGVAVFAGMESAERPLFLDPLAAAGLIVTDEIADGGWWAVAARYR
jgi:ribosomal protein L11 methyltransferase